MFNLSIINNIPIIIICQKLKRLKDMQILLEKK
jgi:hypothetical protein